jgi:hypothetical protein
MVRLGGRLAGQRHQFVFRRVAIGCPFSIELAHEAGDLLGQFRVCCCDGCCIFGSRRWKRYKKAK